MKIFAFLLLFFLALPVTVNAQKELLKFEHPLIDAGTMTEDDAPRTFTFVGKNVSKKILHITQVRTTCGCTSSYVKGDVMKPGDTCQVQLTFTPNRYPGTINTGAYLYLKEVEGQPAVKLALTGKVLPGADQWARYPHKMGVLRLKQAKASITEVKPGTEPEARILCDLPELRVDFPIHNALTSQNDLNTFPNDLQVKFQTDVLDVFPVIVDFVVHIHRVTAVDLCPTSNARRYLIHPVPAAQKTNLTFRIHQWTRTNQAHFTTNHVCQLRQLINTGIPQKTP